MKVSLIPLQNQHNNSLEFKLTNIRDSYGNTIPHTVDLNKNFSFDTTISDLHSFSLNLKSKHEDFPVKLSLDLFNETKLLFHKSFKFSVQHPLTFSHLHSNNNHYLILH